MSTPVRALLIPTSELHEHVADGLDAVKKSERGYLEASIRSGFTDSIDIDEALKPGRDQDHRWDYLLGWGAEHVVALEPHSATNHEVKTVISKKKAALQQLQPHVNPTRSVRAWFWVASGKNDLTPLDKKRLILNQNGITFVAPMLTAKHLPSLPSEGARQSSGKGGKKASRRRR